MASAHDRAAKAIAKKTGGRYVPGRSPDVRGGKARVEVKTPAQEIPTALRQLAGGLGPAYIALPQPEHRAALPRLSKCKTGLMGMRGSVVKSSRRKQ